MRKQFMANPIHAPQGAIHYIYMYIIQAPFHSFYGEVLFYESFYNK